MKKYIFLAIFLCLAACAASGTVQQFTGTPLQLTSADVVVVNATATDPKFEKYVEPLTTQVSARLLESAAVASVVDDPQAASIAIDMTITEVREVGGATRFMFGALAGQAGITVDVVFSDTETNEQIGSLQATGKSSGGSIFAGTTNQAIEQVADQIVDYLATSGSSEETPPTS